ncbi:MAG: hypothetical protein EOO90_20235 [Pedobacter sp.]|nr:MAG: hypothetical protein EOO90_20235 [Pedobacter sp.]
MKLLNSLVGGFAGAIALNCIHETARQFIPAAPHIHKIGEQAVVKLTDAGKIKRPNDNRVYAVALAGDIISNTIYYSAIGVGPSSKRFTKAISLGLTAGTAALNLTGPMGFDDAPVNRTTETKVMTVAWYLIGALVTAAVINSLERVKKF